MPPAALRSRVAPAAPEAPVPEAVPVSRSAPVVVGPPPPPAGVGRTPARAFHIPSALDPGVGRAGSPSRPVTTAARSQSETFQLVVPPPASEVADEMGSFAPVAPNLDAQELFGDLAPTPPPQPVPHMIAPARPAGTGAAEEGLALLAQRRFGEARTRLAEALRREPRNRAIRISYHLCVGYDLRSQGRDDDARKQFESVLVLDPQNSEAVAALRSQSVEKREQRRGFLRKILDRD